MARIRTIKPTFWASGQILECSKNARLLFIGLWNFADDAGRHPYRVKQIKAEIFPADFDTEEEIAEMLRELEREGLIVVYTVENQRFLEITGWHHQRIDKPQDPQYPGPDQGVIQEYSTNDPGTLPPDRKGKERKGEESSLRSERARAKPPAEPPPERLAFDAWNELAAECGLPHADVFDADRAGKIRARLKECGGLPGWEHALARIRGSPFLLGQVEGKDFRAHLDFVLQKRSFRKLMEGTYDGNRTVSKPEKSAARAVSDAAMASVFGGEERGYDGAESAPGGRAGNGGSPHSGAFRVVEASPAQGHGGVAETAIEPLPHAADGQGRT